MTPLDFAFYYLLENEGTHFVNDPLDSGGATKYGITQKTYETFHMRKVHVSEIENMSQSQAQAIYEVYYWKSLQLQKVKNQNMATCIFDCAVLYGQKTAGIMTQKALSLCGANLKFDGVLGDISVTFLNMVKEDTFIKAMHGLVLERIAKVIEASPKNERFRKGWTRRADRLLTLISEKANT